MNTAKSGSDSLTINWRIEQWFPDFDKTILAKLKMYHDEVLLFNKKLPLINVKNIAPADQVYFADSIMGMKAILAADRSSEFYDIGSGNGFPGIVAAILDDKIKLYLVENDPKKIDFLKHIVSYLALTNVFIINKTVESLGDGLIKSGFCRDFNGLAKTLLACRKAFATGSNFYHFKGEEWATEVMSLPSQLCTYWQPSLLADYKLPQSELKRAVVRTVKIQV